MKKTPCLTLEDGRLIIKAPEFITQIFIYENMQQHLSKRPWKLYI